MRRLLVVLMALGCSKGADKAPATAAKPGEGANASAPLAKNIVEPLPTPAPEPEPEFDIRVIKAMDVALKVVLPQMEDSADEHSPGTVLFAVWAADNMRWTDVAVAKNETSAALVLKDSDEARGKRLCARGRIIEIAKEDTGEGHGRIYSGGMWDANANVIRFFAVGSTGELVSRSNARFCGVVAGRYSYENSGGGSTHGIAMVGMFDLPENKPATPAK